MRRIPKPKWIYASGWAQDTIVQIDCVSVGGPYSSSEYDVHVDGTVIGRIEKYRHTPHVKVGRLRRDLKPRDVWRHLGAGSLPYDTAGEAIARLMERQHADADRA